MISTVNGKALSYMAYLCLPLNWTSTESGYSEAIIGDFAAGDGVRFTLQHRPTCYRRGPWWLFVEVAHGPEHHKWGCFDAADQPERYYHLRVSAVAEAEEIAKVLLKDRGPLKESP